MKVRAEHAAEECMHLKVIIIDIVGLLIVWPGYCSAAEAWAPCCKGADDTQDNTAAKLYCQLQTAVALSNSILLQADVIILNYSIPLETDAFDESFVH